MANEQNPNDNRQSGQGNEQQQSESSVNKVIDKAQDYRRGDGQPGTVDKAIDKAQERGWVDKVVNTIKNKLSGGKS